MKMNCIIVDDDELVLHLVETLAKQSDFLNIVKTCSTAVEASNTLLKEKIDLVFLDVMMPGMTGIELLNSFSEKKPIVIMITSNKEFAVDAYDFDVCDFIVKPITQARFLKAVSKAKKIFEADRYIADDDAIFAKVDSVLQKINAHDIFLIEALVDYVAVHTFTHKYIVHSTMKEIKAKLSAHDFFRIHNSYIVRIDKITAIEDNTVVVNKRSIPISRSNHKDLMNRLKLL